MMIRLLRRAGFLALALVFALGLSARSGAQDLGKYNIDTSSISVSGISSGGFMANQLHIAYSKTIKGAGIVAGGPFRCAVAYGVMNPMACMCLKNLGVCNEVADNFVPSPDKLASFLRPVSGVVVDDLKNLADSKVYVFRGTKDTLVRESVSESVIGLYRELGIPSENIVDDDTFPAGHSMPTQDYGIACETEGAPFVNKCGDDVAGKILAHLYGPLKSGGVPVGEPQPYAQASFVEKGEAERWGIHDTGHVYVPKACAEGAQCKLHVALHGCGQTSDDIQDAYYAHAGYNGWAEANNIIVLYPQARKIPMMSSGDPLRVNPFGCWDWWGYTDTSFYKRDGKQMSAVMAMIERVAGIKVARN